MQEMRRKALALLLQLPAGWADRLDLQLHVGLFWRAPALFHIARCAGGTDVFPRGAPAHSARGHMVKRQAFVAAAILAGKPVTQKQVEAGECGKLARSDILPQCNNAGDLHIERGRMHLPVITGNDINPFQKHRLDRGLPRPQAERVIGQRRVIGIQHQGRTAFQRPCRIPVGASKLRCPFDQFGFEHCLRAP